MIIKHYGVTVDSEIPTTGVFANNEVTFLWEELESGINLDYESAYDDYISDALSQIINLCNSYKESEGFAEKAELIVSFLDDIEHPDIEDVESNHWVIGFKKVFKKDDSWYWFETLQYGFAPDKTEECSAIIGESCSQVIRSIWGVKGSLCSPCFPGQVDADSNGEFIGYSFPPDYYEETNPFRKKIFLLEVKE